MSETKMFTAHFIDDHRLEIYWKDEVQGANNPQNFSIQREGKSLPVCFNEEDEAWDTRCIYEHTKRRTTLYLKEPIQGFDLGKIQLRIIGIIKDKHGNQLQAAQPYVIKRLEKFYSRFTGTPSGILIKSSSKVGFEVHELAADMIEKMLSKQPGIAIKMAEQQASLAIYGLQEDCYDIPEHRGGADFLDRPVEGFGGTPEIPTTSISEKNIMRYTEGPSQTRYINESILAHEFAHAIHLIGINALEDQTLAKQFITAYEHAVLHNLWPNTYAISNYEEYFATLTTIWFNVMAESKDGTWDGTRGPVNTREELKIYDPKGYAFFESIYPELNFLAPWHTTPDFFSIKGRRR